MTLQGTSVIQAHDLGKCYKIYDNPKARLKQALWRGNKQYYREFWALRNASFEVTRGESLGIIGRNGSGKSTLLQLICGTLTPTEGKLSTQGRIAALLELGSGFNPEFTGIENVYLNASLHGLSHNKIESRLDEIKAFADIGEFVNQPIKTYSSGMLVRLAFAVIAHVDPSILIVDEALSVGDAIFGQRCMRFIRRFTEQGTLLFVSHDLNSVSSLCQRALWIDAGKLKIDSNNATVVSAYTRYCQLESNSSACTTESSIKPSQYHQSQAEQEDNKTEGSSRQYEFEKESASPSVAENTYSTINHCFAEVAKWNEEHDYGNKNSVITSLSLVNSIGESTSAPQCGENIRLIITSYCIHSVQCFMAGFIVRDKTGMIIWGENNIRHGPLETKAGSNVTISFEFAMPFLKAGKYSFSAAISENDVDMPTIMHYKPDALIVEPILGRHPVYGIFAIPSMNIFTEINP
jgi:lipopolysaccharide transport system ATP-binding protein